MKYAKLGDGTPAYPTQQIQTQYLGETWEAEVVKVGEITIDLRYTSTANHGAPRGTLCRDCLASYWYPLPERPGP